MADKVFFFGDWQIDPAANSVRRGETLRALEPKAMDVLQQLCLQAGEVVSTEELLQRCWPGDSTGDNPLHKAINQLRRALDCDSAHPSYIETIRKRGYRAIAPVQFPIGEAPPQPAAVWRGGSPFPGLRAFGEADADVFFGRGEAISAVLRNLSRQVAAGRGLCLVLGPSGSGKTSLIAAGVLPNLMTARGYDGLRLYASAMLDLALSQPDRLLLDVASALLDWEIGDAPAFAGYSAEHLADALRADPAAVFTSLTALARDDQHSGPAFALFIDRLEAVFADSVDEMRRMQLFRLLDAAAGSGAVLVLLTCRNDFYPQVSRYPLLMDGKAGGAHFDLQPPTRQEWLQMIRLPARAAQLQWQLDEASQQPLDELLCSEASQNPDALPMLQYTLQELYLQRGDDNLLRTSVHHALGGIEGAIGRQADAVLNSLADGPRAALPAVLSLLVTLGADETTITSRSARWQELSHDDQRQLVQAMVDQRLFVSSLQGDEPVFAVAHEALLRRWPRALEWIASQRESLKVHARVLRQAQRWQEEQRNSERLLTSGRPLLEAESLLSGSLPLDDTTRAYIAASGAGARKRRSLRRGVIVTLSLLSLISLAMGWRAWQSEQVAQQKRAEAEGLMGFMVGDLADKLRQIGRMDLLDDVANKALVYLRQNDTPNESEPTRAQRVKTLLALGESAQNRGRLAEAEQVFDAALLQLSALEQLNPLNPAYAKDTGAAHFWLGQIAFQKNDLAQAETQMQAYLVQAKKMRELAPSAADAMLEESYALNSLGSIKKQQRKTAEAIDLFRQSIQLKEQARSISDGSTSTTRDIADSLSWLASTLGEKGSFQESLTLHKRAQMELEALRLSEPQSPIWASRIANTLAHQAYVYDALGQPDNAIQALTSAIKRLDEALQQDAGNLDWQHARYRYESDKQRLMTLDYRLLTEASARRLLRDVESLLEKNPGNGSIKLLHARQYLLTLDHVAPLGGPSVEQQTSLRYLLDEAAESSFRTQTLMELLFVLCEKNPDALSAVCNRAASLLADKQPEPGATPGSLAAWVMGKTLLDSAANTEAVVRQLQGIGYQAPLYLRFLKQHEKRE